MDKIILQTNRTIIRNLKKEDLASFFSYRSNTEICKYQGFEVMSLEECEVFIQNQKDKSLTVNGTFVQFGIEEKKSKYLLGDCAIKINPDLSAEIGITISHLFQKKKYAKEVMQVIIKYLFDNKIQKITEITDEKNEASIALLKSLNFKLTHRRMNVPFKGILCNELEFSLING